VNFDVVLLVNLVLFGVFWSLWALAEGGLWGVFGWHAVTSWVSENLVVVGEGLGYGRMQDGLLLGLNETGPDRLTGGGIGLEASILTSAMLVVGIVVLSVPRARHAFVASVPVNDLHRRASRRNHRLGHGRHSSTAGGETQADRLRRLDRAAGLPRLRCRSEVPR
jgi:hypothetical protein